MYKSSFKQAIPKFWFYLTFTGPHSKRIQNGNLKGVFEKSGNEEIL